MLLVTLQIQIIDPTIPEGDRRSLLNLNQGVLREVDTIENYIGFFAETKSESSPLR